MIQAIPENNRFMFADDLTVVTKYIQNYEIIEMDTFIKANCLAQHFAWNKHKLMRKPNLILIPTIKKSEFSRIPNLLIDEEKLKLKMLLFFWE